MTKTIFGTAVILIVIGTSLRIAAPEDLALQATSCTPGNFASFQCYAALV